jgi:collagenase-like PrtC family protease
MDVELHVGYNGVLADLDRILHVSNKVKGVYTGGVKDFIAGGRQQYAVSLDSLRPQVHLAHSVGVDFEVTLNAPCGIPSKNNGDWWGAVRDYLKEIEAIGVDSVTVSHPFIMSEVKTMTSLRLCVSTICEVSGARAALYYEGLGADVIVPSMNCNWDLDTLRLMKSSLKHARLRIMVNEHCLGDCPWRRFHHNHFAHEHRADYNYLYNCRSIYRDNNYFVLTNNMLRPEDLVEYEGITQSFKVVGRLVPIDDLLLRVAAYSQGSFDGNFVALSDSQLSQSIFVPNKALEGLFAAKSVCNKVCANCRYCRDLFERVATPSAAEKRAIYGS